MTEDDGKRMRFRCPHCSASLRGKSSEAGQRRRCPKCQQPFRIPRPRIPEVAAAPPPKKQLVPVVCDVCQTRMYATLDQVGELMECPDCFRQNLVKPPRKGAKPILESSFSYEMGPESNVYGAHAYAREMIAGAEQEVARQREAEPVAPPSPFLSGVLTFPIYHQVWPIVLGQALSLSIALGLAKAAWELQGGTALLGPLLVVVAGITLVLVSVPTMVCWLTVFENTAQGDDEADCRPEGGLFAFIDWAGDIGYLVLAGSLSWVPGALVGKLLNLPASYLPVLILVASLPFPVLLLSMMETASPLGFYSRPIWQSVFQLPGKWLKFFGLGTILVGSACATLVGLGRLAPSEAGPGVIAGAVALVYGFVTLATIYFRLLGRLAWLLTQEIEVEVVSEESEGSAGAGERQDASEISLRA